MNDGIRADDVRARAISLSGFAAEVEDLMEAIGDASLVLIGEASHGTKEFYRERAEISKRLISEKGFDFVAVEADWPDAYQVNRFVKDAEGVAGATTALGAFQRFPAWMWRNHEVAGFATWLRDYNRREEAGAGFYGLDLYSLYSSIDAVLAYLEGVDPRLAEDARQRYACFEQFEREPQAFGYSVGYAGLESCEDEAVAQLREMQALRQALQTRDARLHADESFFAEQNAPLIANAEAYYRAMYRSDVSSWNLRDTHMVETLEALLLHLQRVTPRPKGIVWAHNSHLGDARATSMSLRGELNLGQLVRQRFGADAFSIGFTTYDGYVTAASNWGDDPRQRFVRPGLEGSYEKLFHETGIGRFLLLTPRLPASRLLERAIGVIYRPETERQSHYFQADIAAQFDAVIHLDRTAALQPLEADAAWYDAERPAPAGQRFV